MRHAIPWLLVTGLLTSVSAPAVGEGSASPGEAVTSGKPILNFRARYENAEQSGKDTGEAYTLRTLAGWKTNSWDGLSGMVELINVGRLSDDYNDGLNGKTRYPVIADPDNTDVNQIYLDYAGLPDTVVRAGRQSIKLDNVRFIGNVEFRQVMQVFNGVTMENNSLPNTRIYGGYLGRVKSINTTQHGTDTILLNVRHSVTSGDTVTGYGYFQDQYDAIAGTAFSGTAPRDTSNQIVGLRADGAHPFDEKWKLLYTAEYAMQSDYASGDPRIDAHYLRLGIGGQSGDYFARVDQELLSSNNGQYAFQMPLATNHLFQGWADLFLSTPPQGIRDTFLTAGARIEKAQLLGEYHQFKSDFGSIDFGDELDFSVSWPLMQKLVGKLEFADYQAGDAASGKVDVRKIWLTLIFNY